MPPDPQLPKLRVIEQRSDAERLDALQKDVVDLKDRVYDPDTGLYNRISQIQSEVRFGFQASSAATAALTTKVDELVASQKSHDYRALESKFTAVDARVSDIEKLKSSVVSGLTWFIAAVMTGMMGAAFKFAFDFFSKK